LSFKIYVKAL
jgi:hypothetical protein